jgi:hypothetical protein
MPPDTPLTLNPGDTIGQIGDEEIKSILKKIRPNLNVNALEGALRQRGSVGEDVADVGEPQGTGLEPITKVSDKFEVDIPQDIKNIKQWSLVGGIDAKERKKRLEIYEKLRDDYFKTGAISPEVERVKIGIVNALLPQLGRLQQIETTSDPLSVLNWLYQKAGGKINLNPELSGFLQASEGLKIPILRGLLGEKGATQEKEQEAAKEISLPSGKEIFSTTNRPEVLESVFSTILGTSGVDIRPHLEEKDPDLLEALGAFPSGSKGALSRRGVMSSDELEKIIEKEITGPQVGFLGQPTDRNFFEMQKRKAETIFPGRGETSETEDQEAIDWARKNPDDPRAREIINKVGGK